jgi:imidazolonepropionase-like amidohydrolase
MGTVADGPDAVRRAAREELRRGADQIKVMASGGVMSVTDRLTSSQYSTDELRAAVEAAESVGTYVLAHAYPSEAIRNCVASGVRSIEHGNLLDRETAELMAAQGTFLVPTLVTYEKLHDEGASHRVGREQLDKLETIIEAGSRSLHLAHEAGVKIASGSDLLGPMRRFQGEEIALQAQVLGSMGAIIASTRTNAELLGIEHEAGTLERGKRADLVAVDGDVIADPHLLGHSDRIVLVVQHGDIVVSRLDAS